MRKLLMSSVQYDKALSKLGQQQLVTCTCIVNYAEMGKYLACVADETKPRYSPSANQRPKACSAPRVLPVLSIIGSNWLLHMAVLSCTVIGRVDVVEPWLRSR